MGVPIAVLNQMIIDIQAGREGPADEPPEYREVRGKLAADIREMEARGQTVHMQAEILEDDDQF